ncbi:MAG TPA: serine hydrolase [Pyrinomonadaceae bacterium]|nr:serine hydrolase [Pyrinomonadaceae bacterium]
MHKLIVGVLFCVAILTSTLTAQQVPKDVEIVAPANSPAWKAENSAELQKIIGEVVGELVASTAAASKPFKPEEVAVTLIDLRDPQHIRWANVRGEEAIYPASVVKMFYMAALHQQLQDGKVKLTPELQRGLKDMIVDSSNEATQYILDVLTDTASGAEMPQPEFEKWQYKRNRVNRYFGSMGYKGININQKTFCEDAYGIEQQSRAYKGQNRNMLTTNATARLLAEIALGRSVNADRSRQMMDLMKRDPFAESKDPDSQSVGFSGKALITRKMIDAKLWSKAGWTSRTRHDAAYIETADGGKFVLAIFTEGHANENEHIGTVVGKVIDRLKK